KLTKMAGAHQACPSCGAAIPGETKTCGSCGKVRGSLFFSAPVNTGLFANYNIIMIDLPCLNYLRFDLEMIYGVYGVVLVEM
ncbi:hypothetical protein ASPFODRAFT_146654, partial [Aspergillus luchuensis CBS 106.47]